jgi:hypothetical protein
MSPSLQNNTANVVVQQHSRKSPEDGHINARNMLSVYEVKVNITSEIYLSQYLTNLMHKICYTINNKTYCETNFVHKVG